MSYKGLFFMGASIPYTASVYNDYVANMGSAPTPGTDILVSDDGVTNIVTDDDSFIEVV